MTSCTDEMNSFMTTLTLNQSARNSVIRAKFTKLYNLKFELGLLDDPSGAHPVSLSMIELRDEIKRLQTLKDSKEPKTSQKTLLHWINIGVNPSFLEDAMMKSEDNEPFQDREYHLESINRHLHAQALKLATCFCVDDWAFCMEQRRDHLSKIKTQVDVGQHFHILLIRNPKYSPSHLRKEAVRIFHNITTIDNPQIFNIHNNVPMAFIPDKLEYMKGHKTGNDATGKPKVRKVKYDKIFRDMYHLPQFNLMPNSTHFN